MTTNNLHKHPLKWSPSIRGDVCVCKKKKKPRKKYPEIPAVIPVYLPILLYFSVFLSVGKKELIFSARFSSPSCVRIPAAGTMLGRTSARKRARRPRGARLLTAGPGTRALWEASTVSPETRVLEPESPSPSECPRSQ